jgi:hypothetical protein
MSKPLLTGKQVTHQHGRRPAGGNPNGDVRRWYSGLFKNLTAGRRAPHGNAATRAALKGEMMLA